ncbi:MAG: putative regulator of Ras-like GTPase activity, Roadblock/LC7/MglB family [Candidatus Electronema aureum]|uniref:Regulator of Ras-like GTPase activity, Roadblock/LC7/MglB family n=1 Tax=Candidatus Electronema aureum TaxID=2005002 RepID=A0A521G5F5_9BACT|nr:roadblock/LC7 domain-containing protein [Desulfobulbus sp. F5]TAA76255.1 MAG: putative regulator of Ras-like GTPase activity, Roadblock/LC7/MglB family [Candidatus Electronema aureum]
MDVQKKLSRLAEIDGFLGTALFSAEGRLLAKCEPFDFDLKLVASLANGVLVNAQKASLDMGFGRCQFTYVHTEKALILIRCLNEGRNPLRTEPGKCHIHLVLLVDNPDSFGIAKLEINKVIESLAEDFRMPETTLQLPKRKPLQPAQAARQQEQQRQPPAAVQRHHLRDVAESLDNEKIDAMFDGLLMQPARMAEEYT